MSPKPEETRPNPQGIQVTVRPIGDPSKGGANADLAPHLEQIGKVVADGFTRMMKVVKPALPDEFKVTIGLKLEGTTNWVVAGAKAEASIEVEGTWKKGAG